MSKLFDFVKLDSTIPTGASSSMTGGGPKLVDNVLLHNVKVALESAREYRHLFYTRIINFLAFSMTIIGVILLLYYLAKNKVPKEQRKHAREERERRLLNKQQRKPDEAKFAHVYSSITGQPMYHKPQPYKTPFDELTELLPLSVIPPPPASVYSPP